MTPWCVYDEYGLGYAAYHKIDIAEISPGDHARCDAADWRVHSQVLPQTIFSNDYSLLMPLTKFRQVDAG
jgi:hypothetical protein